MESVFNTIMYIIFGIANVSFVSKIIYFLFFKDRLINGTISEKQSSQIAGKKYIEYSQVIFIPKGYVCEDSDVEEYFKSKNKKVLSLEELDKLSNNRARVIVSTILVILSFLINIIEIIVLSIWNRIKKFLPYFKGMIGMSDGIIRYNKRRAREELFSRGYSNLSEEAKTWLNF